MCTRGPEDWSCLPIRQVVGACIGSLGAPTAAVCVLQVWKLSATDLCEIARNSVLHSGFPHQVCIILLLTKRCAEYTALRLLMSDVMWGSNCSRVNPGNCKHP